MVTTVAVRDDVVNLRPIRGAAENAPPAVSREDFPLAFAPLSDVGGRLAPAPEAAPRAAMEFGLSLGLARLAATGSAVACFDIERGPAYEAMPRLAVGGIPTAGEVAPGGAVTRRLDAVGGNIENLPAHRAGFFLAVARPVRREPGQSPVPHGPADVGAPRRAELSVLAKVGLAAVAAGFIDAVHVTNIPRERGYCNIPRRRIVEAEAQGSLFEPAA